MRVNERPWGGGPEERDGLRGRGPEEKGVWGEGRAWGRDSKMGIPGLSGRPELICWRQGPPRRLWGPP